MATQTIVTVTATGFGPHGVDLVDVLGTGFAHHNGSYYRVCVKCEGSGYLPGYEFSDGARCWGCNASGVTRKLKDLGEARRIARREAAKRRKAEEAAEQRRIEREEYEQRAAAWREANPDIVTWFASKNELYFSTTRTSDLYQTYLWVVESGLLLSDEEAARVRDRIIQLDA